MATPTSHVDELLKLPRADRAAAAEKLLVSLEDDADDDDAAVAAAWAAEIERRIAADQPGIPAQQVLDPYPPAPALLDPAGPMSG